MAEFLKFFEKTSPLTKNLSCPRINFELLSFIYFQNLEMLIYKQIKRFSEKPCSKKFFIF